MKMIWIVGLLALAGCAGSKPPYDETPVGDGFMEIVLTHSYVNQFMNMDRGEDEMIFCVVSGIELQLECYERAYSPLASKLNVKSFYVKDDTTLVIRLLKK
jgi:hypothetical protein